MNENELDQLIANYVPEPSPGIERRVLIRVRRPRLWIPLGAMAAAVLLVISLSNPPDPGPPALIVTTPSVPAAPEPLPSRPSMPRLAKGVPLTAQERLFGDFVQTYPELAMQVLHEAPKEVERPLQLKPLNSDELTLPVLTIEPLKSPDGVFD